MWLALAFSFLSFFLYFLNINVILINKYDFNAFSCSFVFSSKILQYLNVFYFIIYYNYYCY